MSSCKRLLYVLLLFWLPLAGQTGNFIWQTQSSFLRITCCSSDSAAVWLGTEGGMLIYTPANESFITMTNTDGLPGKQVTAVSSAVQGGVWAGFNSGMIGRITIEKGTERIIDDFAGFRINKIVPRGDSLWVAHDIGISLYIVSKSEVKETYRQLSVSMQRDQAVKHLLLTGDRIWAGTSAGLAAADIRSPNLLDPGNWTRYTAADGLPSDEVLSLGTLDGILYAGTEEGVCRFDNDRFNVVLTARIFDLYADNEALYAGGEACLYRYSGDTWTPLGSCSRTVHCLTVSGDTVYSGTSEGMLRFAGGSLELLRPDCIGGNLISGTAADGEGGVWVTTRDNGFYHYNHSTWTSYTVAETPGLRSRDQYTVFHDSRNRTWIGSWGGGLTMIDESGTLSFFHPDSGLLSGIPNDASYSVINGIAEDGEGTVWFLNYYAASSQPLAAFTAGDQWLYYGQDEGITTSYVSALAVDEFNRKWIGTRYNGIYVYDDSGTPGDRSDDPAVIRYTTADGLASNEITSLAVGPDGTVWIGTPAGLHYIFDYRVQELYGIPSAGITALCVDPANNIWAGSSTGLNYFNAAEYRWYLFTESDSYLLDDEITTLSVDSDTGILYIGTNKGLTLLETPFIRPSETIGGLTIYPNPFKPAVHSAVIIDDLASDVSVSIFTAGGLLVRQFDSEQVYGRRLSWDGLLNSGASAASGVYLAVAVSPEGRTQTGKFILVR